MRGQLKHNVKLTSYIISRRCNIRINLSVDPDQQAVMQLSTYIALLYI